MILFAPIPPVLIDLSIVVNFAFALTILLLTFYVGKPVEFSTFPSLLLVATLFRVALNVAATRLILTSANAGQVIGSIGTFAVQGNFVVGLVVFFILVVVQYVVVTAGAQRVSEVAARFTLDAMPGQQMSIDADLNMGFIDQAEAQRRRKTLEREATFYGAMDGASKFVKGDAIAGIVILLIDIIGGLVIGIMQRGMHWDQALHTYTLLTIGDGIVTQVPALVIALGTGIIVTRSASDGNLSQQALRQITSFPKTLGLVAGAMFALLLLPGIPALPTLALAACVCAAAWIAYKARVIEAVAEPARAEPGEAAADDPYRALAIEPIEVAVGSNWLSVASQPDGMFAQRIASFRKQHAQEMGMVLPAVRFRAAPKLARDRYEVHVDGVLAARGEARLGELLAIHPSGETRSLEGEVTRDPTYGLPAVWIRESQREAAVAGKFTLVDAQTVFITHLAEVLRREAATLLTRGEVDRLLARVREAQPGLVEELVPTVLSLSDVQKVLQGLLREKVAIRNVEAIVETLIDTGRASKDAAFLIEAARRRLGHSICQSLVGEGGALHVLTIDPGLESQLMQGVRAGGPAPQAVALEPRLAEQFVTRLVQSAERMMKSNFLPVLLCSPELRRHVRALSERVMPHLRVLSMLEIPQAIELKSYGVVALPAP